MTAAVPVEILKVLEKLVEERKLAHAIKHNEEKLKCIDERLERIECLARATDRELDATRLLAEQILDAVTPSSAASMSLTIVMEGGTIKGATSLTIKDTQKFTVNLAVKDSKGAPAAIDPTKTTFTVDNPAIATLVPGADGLSCQIIAGSPGSGQIQATVTDANNPTDVINGILHLDVLPGDAVVVELQTSSPEDQ